MKKNILPFLSALFLSLFTLPLLASTTGGAIGNLFPAPKLTKGKIQHGIYSWGVADTARRFHIRVPQYGNKEEYKYLQIKEERYPLNTYVSFGPGAFDQNIYRVSIVKKTDKTTPFIIRAKNAFNYITQSLVNQHQAAFKKIAFKKINKKGHQGMMSVAQLTTANSAFINVNYLFDGDHFMLLFSADLYPKPGQSITTLKARILHDNDATWNQFVNSFALD